MKKHYLNRGRPPLDQSVKRYKAIHLRLREDEFEEIKERAKRLNMTTSRYIRETLRLKEEK